MRTSKKGQNFITAHEQDVLRAYKDPVGIWTIGRGITSAAGVGKISAGMKITQAESDRLFDLALRKYELRVSETMGTLVQHEFDGSVSFDWNTGKVTKATWVKKFLAKDHAGAENSIKLWVKAGGKTLPGLVRRRNEEADLIFRGVYAKGIAGAVAKRKAISKDEVIEAQEVLKSKGLYDGTVDGILGKKTRAAVLAYQKLHPSLTNDGVLGIATLSQLRRDTKAIGDIIRSSAPASLPLAASLATDLGSWMVPILAISGALLVVVVGAVIYRHRESLMRRLNMFLRREVE